MNEKFSHGTSSMEINDEGLTYVSSARNLRYFFPYGSLDKISVKIGGVVIAGANAEFVYSFGPDEKKRFKNILPTLESMNQKAERTVPITSMAEEKKLVKSWDSFKDYFANAMDEKHEREWRSAVTEIINAMEKDEEILYGFRGDLFEKNRARETVYNYIAVITNKKFYYAGNGGQGILFIMKNGSVALKDVHAVTAGAGTGITHPFVKFEVNNDDYKVTTFFGNVTMIKEKLEAAIKECENASNTPTVVQAAVSPMEELKKLKELLDMGIVTQEEFDAKKKQLLGL